MNNSLESILIHLINKRIFGAKHTPEKNLINSKTKWISKLEKKEFIKQYKRMVNDNFILRFKKKTGKSSGWHISLNPKKLKEISEVLKW